MNISGVGSESSEQKAFFRWWGMMKHRWPNCICFAIPNGGRRDAITGARLRLEGVLAGVPDIFLAKAASGKYGMFIEMKTKRGRVSESQRGLFPLLEAQGYGVAVCRGWHEAAETVEAYLAGRWEPSHA
jgi:hypothetical protein